MSYNVKLIKDLYCNGFDLFEKESVELKTGLTILVGCNGFGKSSFIDNLTNQIKAENIPYYKYNNLREGNTKSIDRTFKQDNNMELGILMLKSSEGENIINTIGKFIGNMYRFIVSGENPDKLQRTSDEELENDCNKRFIIMDAIDSGLSIDNIVDLKSAFEYMIRDAKDMGIELYIIVSANSYEFASNEDCLDVYTGNYLRFDDYDSYKDFIIKTGKIKEERYDNYNKNIR